MVAVVSVFPVEEFCGPIAESRMQDLSWVGPRACRHEEVVEQVMRVSPVLPVRFGTIFSSLERLDRVLKGHHDAMSGFLDRVAGKEEWAVKGMLNRARAREELFSTALAAHEERLASSSPGKRYFQEQRIRSRVEKELTCWLKGVCKDFAAELDSYASEFRERRVIPGGNEGIDMVLNWAFLVSRSAVTDFRARIDRANARHAENGLVFEVSGPWPPYSFCPSLEGDSDR